MPWHLALARNSRIAAAGFADFVLSGGDVAYSRPGETGERDSANGGLVTAGWFDTMRARVLAGATPDPRRCGHAGRRS